MTVYVDDMRARVGPMVMCHMLADTDDELHAMADRIGVDRRWHNKPPKASTSHYDISLAKRAIAVAAGAVEITRREAAAMAWRRRVEGELGRPSEAREWAAMRRRSNGGTKCPHCDADTRFYGCFCAQTVEATP